MALHHAKELDDDLRGRADEHLTLAPSLSIDNVVLQRVSLETHNVSQSTYQAVVLACQLHVSPLPIHTG